MDTQPHSDASRPTPSYRPDYFPCGCGGGHLCHQAKALWKELLSWFLRPNSAGFEAANQAWSDHFKPVDTSQTKQDTEVSR